MYDYPVEKPKSRIRKWMDDRNIQPADVVTVGIFAATIGGVIVLTVKASKNLQEEYERETEWRREQENSGRTIIEDGFGRLIAVENIRTYY